MINTGIKDMRQNITHYLDLVQKGEEVIITKRNVPIAKLVPVKQMHSSKLGSREQLRSMIDAHGPSLSQTLIDDRGDRL